MVWQADVDEALRLMRMSKVSLLENGGRAEQRDPVSLVYEALRDDAQRSGKQTYTWADLTTLLGHKFSVRALSSAHKPPLHKLFHGSTPAQALARHRRKA